MPVISGTSVAFFEESDLTRHDIHLAMIFLLIIAVALAVQAAGIMLAASFASKLFLRVDRIANEVQGRALPLIDKTHTLIEELTPKIQATTTNVEQISYTIREKVDELGATVTQLNETVQGINLRTRAQVSRVDGIVTDALVATEEISATVQQGIRGPIRQISGVIAGLRAGIDTLIERSPFGRG
jgi:methyl-accepting chemotaxis protein